MATRMGPSRPHLIIKAQALRHGEAAGSGGRAMQRLPVARLSSTQRQRGVPPLQLSAFRAHRTQRVEPGHLLPHRRPDLHSRANKGNIMKNTNGLTLVELLIAIVGIAIIGTLIYSTFSNKSAATRITCTRPGEKAPYLDVVARTHMSAHEGMLGFVTSDGNHHEEPTVNCSLTRSES